jgi:cytochrome c553
MRRSTLLILAATIAVAVPMSAKMPYVAKAKAAGAAVENCASCHKGAPKKGGDLTEMGTFAKTNEKAGEPDYAKLAAKYPKK